MEFKQAKRICILNLIPNTLGDSLYLIGITRVIKKNMPNATIAITCAPLTEQLLKHEPTISELKIFPVLADIGKPLNKWKKAKMYFGLMKDLRAYLKQEQFDACIVTLPLFAPTQLIPWLAGIPIRVGYTFKGSFFSFLLTHKTQARGAVYSGEKSRHFRQTSLDLMRLLDLPFTDDETRIRYEPTADDLKAAHDVLAKLPKKPFIAFQAGAKWPDKRWPEERFGELAKRITDAHDVHI
ncbi:glycosyltransferase family 9 protein, partial [Candidatus Woesearchaeota archaeon]|nr:glycosyltransferase family 9 protein [Candidatus Woesearchaeota archaeon]